MSYPGIGKALNGNGVNTQPLAQTQVRTNAPDPTNSSSSALSISPSVGAPSRISSCEYSLMTAPTEFLYEMAGFLSSKQLVTLSRTSKQFHTDIGCIQRRVPADHWKGGRTQRTDEQRDLTEKMFSHGHEMARRGRLQGLSVLASEPNALDQMFAIESQALADLNAQASSIGSRFRHVRLVFDNASSAGIAAALANADGWRHLELIVVDIKPLAGVLLSLAKTQVRKRAACPEQPDRHLTLDLRSFQQPDDHIKYLLHVVEALHATPCGVRIVGLHLELPMRSASYFTRFIENTRYMERIIVKFYDNAAPSVDALRKNCSALKYLELDFTYNGGPVEQKELAALFDGSATWELDRLSIIACNMEVKIFSPAFFATCNIRVLELCYLKFDAELKAPREFGMALAANEAIESLKFSGFRFSSPDGLVDVLKSLQGSVSLKQLTLESGLAGGLGARHMLLSPQIINCISEMKSLCTINFCGDFSDQSFDAIDALRVARPDLGIFVFNSAVDDDSTNDSSDDWTDGDSDGSDVEPSDEDDVLANLDEAIQHARIAENQ